MMYETGVYITVKGGEGGKGCNKYGSSSDVGGEGLHVVNYKKTDIISKN